jgi:hypothetical protein
MSAWRPRPMSALKVVAVPLPSRAKKKLAAVHHPGQHGADDGVVRPDQDVVAGEALELERKMHDRVLRGAQQRVAEPETGGGDGGREDVVRADRQEPAGAPLHLDQSERAARPRRGQELVHERAIHRQPGQQRDNVAHWSSAASRGWMRKA